VFLRESEEGDSPTSSCPEESPWGKEKEGESRDSRRGCLRKGSEESHGEGQRDFPRVLRGSEIGSLGRSAPRRRAVGVKNEGLPLQG